MEIKTRKEFISFSATLAGLSLLSFNPGWALSCQSRPAEEAKTVRQVIDLFLKEIPGTPFPQTVDTLKAGTDDLQVAGIVTTMFATLEVIEKAILLDANFIIAHEPTYYNHLDATDWLEGDDVYRHKAALLRNTIWLYGVATITSMHIDRMA